MLLEFKLPASAGMTYQSISRQIKDINSRHSTRIVEHLREGYKYVVECSEQDYTVLCLVWNNRNPWHRWRVIEAEDLGETLSASRVKPGASPLKRKG